MSRATRIRYFYDVCRRTAQTTENVDGERAAYYPFLPSADTSTVEARGTEFAQLLCLGLVRVGEHVALLLPAKGFGAVFHIPVGDEADKIKEIVKSSEGYELFVVAT